VGVHPHCYTDTMALEDGIMHHPTGVCFSWLGPKGSISKRCSGFSPVLFIDGGLPMQR